MTGVSLKQLQWWVEQGVITPQQRGHKRLYQLHEVIEISVITELRRKGISLQKVRRVLRYLYKEFGKGLYHAISSEMHLLTDGQNIYLEDSHRNIVDIVKNARHPVISVCLSDQVEQISLIARMHQEKPQPSTHPPKAKRSPEFRSGRRTKDSSRKATQVVEFQAGRPIIEEIQRVIPDHQEWLDTPNAILFGRKPSELIAEGHEEPIRDLIWSVVHVGVS
jgi:DNA-binding transcriptional MerR regulator